MKDTPKDNAQTPEAAGDSNAMALEPTELGPSDRREALKEHAGAPRLLPDSIGKFQVIRFLGQGAMGTVYLARDEDLDRKVAIKLLKQRDDADTDAQLRMRREAQALARLSHANVVHVYEVGEHRGDIYIAMEFVEGETIRAWLGARPRGWEEILRIYVEAGDGLAAAHAAGLVHRDFKPDNVLVASDGHAKVLDFGLARLGEISDESAGAQTETSASGPLRDVTQAGSIVGTPAYMAPEQHAGLRADARSDQFSFCVALFEAIYGTRPFPAANATETRQAIARGLETVPTGAGKVPSRLFPTLRRGLALDPAERHPSMQALLATLRRDTRKSSIWLWTSLFGLTAIAVATLPWLAVDQRAACKNGPEQLTEVWDQGRAQALRQSFNASQLSYAADTLERTAPELDAYADRWTSAYTRTCLDHQEGSISAALLDQRMQCLRTRREELRALLDVLLGGSAEAIENASQAVKALTPVEHCDVISDDTRVQVPPLAIENDVLLLSRDLARIKAEYDAGLYDNALPLASAAVERAQALAYKPTLAQALGYHGMLLNQKGRFAEAEAALFEAEVVADSHGDDRLRAEFLATLVVVVGERQSRLAEGLRIARQAWAALVRTGGDPAIEVWLLVAEGTLLRLSGENLAARARLERALELAEEVPGDAATVLALGELGNVAIALAEYPAAGNYLEQALALTRQELGPGHPKLVYLGNNLAALYMLDGRLDLAERSLQEALEIAEVSLGAEHPMRATLLDSHGLVRLQRGDHSGAVALFERACAILEASLGPMHASLMPVILDLFEAQIAMKAVDHAIVSADRMIAIREANGLDTVHDLYFVQLLLRFAPQLSAEQSERSRNYLELALSMARTKRSLTSVILCLAALGEREHTAGFGAQARKRLNEAAELELSASPDVDPIDLGQARLALATAWWAVGERERGLTLATSIALPDVGAENIKAALTTWLEAARAGREPPPLPRP